MIVVDASALAAALLGANPAVVARISSEPALHAPHLLTLEVTSVLRRFAQAGQISDRVARGSLRTLARLPLTFHPHVALLRRVWELRDNLSVYDAAYVALAEALRMPLVTSDARLSRAPGLRCVVEVV